MGGDEWPYMIARENDVVLAINSDYAQTRINQRQTVGIIIRDGVIIEEKTKKQNAKGFPNLDTLALFPDGSMQVFWSDELAPQDYLDMGATDVLAFGPYLIRGGELNEYALEKYGTSHAQRTAVGMVEPGHYVAILCEGRLDRRSEGVTVSYLAKLMRAKGCVNAFNLDGGQTAVMIFMGKQINLIGEYDGGKTNSRKTCEVMGVGYSDQVGVYEVE